jgi:dTDP-4-dehydrorhamnose 3,5-epimerase
MRVIATRLPGVIIVELPVYRDARGHFLETWRRARYAEAGLPAEFVQDNISYSTRGVLRGLHYQWPHPQGKLLTVLRGEVFDVAVDLRAGSPTFGRWEGVTLSAENARQLYIPEGFAHGFVVTGDDALVSYKATESYRPECDAAIAWDDPALGIAWPVADPTLSAKDRAAPRLADVPAGRLPRWQAG